jgi:hypothetical protein
VKVFTRIVTFLKNIIHDTNIGLLILLHARCIAIQIVLLLVATHGYYPSCLKGYAYKNFILNIGTWMKLLKHKIGASWR